MDRQEWVWLARIRRPQGRKGEVLADILTDFPEKFADRKQVWLLAGTTATPKALPRAIALDRHWLHKGDVVLHFAGIGSIDEAEALRDLVVAIPREQRVALGEDEAYIGDLVGCALVDVAGTEPTVIGEVEDVDRGAGPVALLVVAGSGGEVLVPFAKAYLRRIDLDGKRIEMALPEGLVEVNAPGPSRQPAGADPAAGDGDAL